MVNYSQHDNIQNKPTTKNQQLQAKCLIFFQGKFILYYPVKELNLRLIVNTIAINDSN